jgi:hypothetical protein
VDPKSKRAKPGFIVNFTTALPPSDCQDRLERSDLRLASSSLAPITQRVKVDDGGTFVVERSFPLALHPIRLVGHLDPDADGEGTWVHGAITHDTANQVLIEGLVIFITFFLFTALFYLRLRTRSLIITGPMLVLMLALISLRWRALRRATEDVARWLRQRLYLTAGQVRRIR